MPIELCLPGEFNMGNATVALAAATAVLGIDPAVAAKAFKQVDTVASRYAMIEHGRHRLRLLLAKNPAGWTQTLPLLDPASALLLVVNAREADGRDASWLWNVPFERLTPARGARSVVAAGERAADLGLRLAYAHVEHRTVPDPLAALAEMADGDVDVVANYTAFPALSRRIAQTSR